MFTTFIIYRGGRKRDTLTMQNYRLEAGKKWKGSWGWGWWGRLKGVEGWGMGKALLHATWLGEGEFWVMGQGGRVKAEIAKGRL